MQLERNREVVDIYRDDTQSRPNESSRAETQLRHRIIIASTNVLYTFGLIKRRRRRANVPARQGQHGETFIFRRQPFRSVSTRGVPVFPGIESASG